MQEWLDRDPKAVVLVDPGLVGAAGDVAPPLLMVEIPVHRLPNSTLETDAAAAAEFVGQLGRVDRVAVIVAGAVGDKADQRAARAAGGGGAGRKARGEVGSRRRRRGRSCRRSDPTTSRLLRSLPPPTL